MTRPRLRIASALRLESSHGGIANPKWVALLASLENSPSITAAAKSAGLSYKGAWQAIDAMNNLAGQPVVTTAVGGKGGGGARLTPHGRELLATCRFVEAENRRFLEALNERLGHARQGLASLGRISLATSARNQWAGTVAGIARGVVNDDVEIELHSGDRITTVITHESSDNLGLQPGREVIALVKASSVMIGKGRTGLRLSARNQLAGTVTRLTRGSINSEVVIRLRRGYTIAAVITNESLDELGLAVGQKAWAVFKASSVILTLPQ
jgi:molybdate transport system regulatory protein